MSRNLPPAVAVAFALAVGTVAGCSTAGGSGASDASGSATVATVAVGGVLEAFPTTAVPSTSERATSTSSTSTTSTTSTTTTVPPPVRLRDTLASLVDGVVVADAPPVQRLVDDTGRLAMDVPEAWADRSTSTGRTAEGAPAPYLAASPDMREFLDGYDVPGITAVALSADDDVQAVLDSYQFGDDCRSGSSRPYEGAAMTGEWRVFRDCGGTANDIVTVVVEPDGASGTVLVLAQIVGPEDLAAMEVALDSMTVLRR
ncbi:MAG: hypothetical protein ABW328_08475 [Ilumatobacteraceae bacterium]